MLLLDHDDRVKRIGLRFEAYAPAECTRIARAVTCARANGDFSDAVRAIRASSPPPLTATQRRDLEARLGELRGMDATSAIVRPLEFELERADFLARIPDQRDWWFAFHLFAVRARLDISREGAEGLIWLLAPNLRGASAYLFEHLPEAADVARQHDGHAAPEALRLVFGTEQLVVDGEKILGPREHGLAERLGTNSVLPEALPKLQADLEAAVPRPLAKLLPDWRRSFPFSFHAFTTRLIFSSEPERAKYLADLVSDANRHFDRIMRTVDRTIGRIGAFRVRAHRRGWLVSATDALNA